MSSTRGYTGVEAAVKFKRGIKPKHNVAFGVLGEIHHHSILLRWRSSLWKLTGVQLIVYTLLYLAISLVYRLALTDEQAKVMNKLIIWMRTNSASLPLTFLLGFYVSLVVKRWWEQYVKLPWPDDVAYHLKVAIMNVPTGETNDGENKLDRNHNIRLTVMRYLMLSYVLCMRRISSRVRKTYPDMESIVTTDLLREDEAARIGKEEEEEMQRHGGSKWWLPIKWSIDILKKAQMEGRFVTAPSYTALVGKICDFRKGLTQVASYGHVPIPLVYTQVVHLAVYIHFAVRLVGDQWLVTRTGTIQTTGLEGEMPATIETEKDLDLYYPIFLTIKFLFYFGWLNVAQTLYNPFGCDDDDFELIDLINRHMKIAATIVDEGDDYPEVRCDAFWKTIRHADDAGKLTKENEFQMNVVEEIKEEHLRKISFGTRTESRDQGQ